MAASSEALRRLALASDFEAVRVFEVFAKRISDHVSSSRDALISNLPEDLRVVDGAEVVQQLEIHADESLPPGASVQSARYLLALAAEDPGLAPLVTESFENWRDDRQLVDVVLAIGLVGSVWMVLASTKITVKDGKFELEKSANTPQQLKAFADVIRAIWGPRGNKLG